MPIAPPPVIVPNKCIFYLDGTKERTGRWKRVQFNDVDVVDKRYTSKSNNGWISFHAREKIQNPSGTYSASLFAKRNVVDNRYEEIGFYFNSIAESDIGYEYGNYIFVDDNSTSARANLTDMSSIISGKELDVFFMTFCKDTDGTSYVTFNGKLIYTTKNLQSPINFFDVVNLFNTTNSGSITGWIDKVIIHKDICLYKEDFTVLPMDQYPKYKYITDNDSLRLY
jgi:hypothetical protein